MFSLLTHETQDGDGRLRRASWRRRQRGYPTARDAAVPARTTPGLCTAIRRDYPLLPRRPRHEPGKLLQPAAPTSGRPATVLLRRLLLRSPRRPSILHRTEILRAKNRRISQASIHSKHTTDFIIYSHIITVIQYFQQQKIGLFTLRGPPMSLKCVRQSKSAAIRCWWPAHTAIRPDPKTRPAGAHQLSPPLVRPPNTPKVAPSSKKVSK